MPVRPAAFLPVLALTFNALVWGLSWWPLRHLEGLGLHPLWATAVVFAVSTLLIAAWRPQAVGEVVRTPALWVLVVAAGGTNAAFNWAVAIGDVVRVVLLFYLMPLWAAVLARLLLHEALTWQAGGRVLLALAGAAIVLWPAPGPGSAWWQALPVPRTLPDFLGLAGGFCFALNNVMLRREAASSGSSRALAMFAGGVVVAGTLAVVLATGGTVPWVPAPDAGWALPALGLSLVFLCSNLALQFGASRLPSNITSVVMLSEVAFAAASAAWLGAGRLTPAVLAGGGLILLAAAWSVAAPAAPPARPRRGASR